MKVPARQQVAAAGTLPFDHCVIVYNPRSTQAEQTKQRIEQLRKLFPRDAVTLLEVQRDAGGNRTLLHQQAAKLSSRTLLAVGGGDGTVNFVINTLLTDPFFTPEQRQTVVLPLWGGNANDLACMLNGAPGRTSIPELIQAAKRVTVYPLRCEMTADGTADNRIAVCYASFGASAFAAQQLETLRGIRPFFHALLLPRFVHELTMVVRALLSAPRFLVSDGDVTHPVFDRVFINGSRWAKVNGVPQKLTDRQYFYITVEQKRAAVVAYHIAEMTRRHPERYVVSGDRAISFTLHEPTLAQIDGEVMKLASGTDIRISLNEQPFYALSTLLPS